MRVILIKISILTSMLFLFHACKPVENYPMKSVIVAFNWEKCNSLNGRVIVLDRYPLEPPVYGSTRSLSRNTIMDTLTYTEIRYRGNLTLERYDNPENFQYASVKGSTAIANSDTVEIFLWEVLQTFTQ